jgi:AraC-like DNA-binding protein
MYVVAGRGECVIDSKATAVGPDTSIVLMGGQRHQLVDAQGEPMAVFVVYFSDAIAKASGEVAAELFRTPQPYSIPKHYAGQIRRMLRRMLYEQDSRPPQYQSAIQQCLSYILLELYRVSLEQHKEPQQVQTPDSAKRVRNVLDYVSGRYYEQQSLAVAAKMAHLSQRQFVNLCRKLTGKSFVNFVNGVRSERARGLLMRTEMPVSAIAFEVGFEELSTFYRAFRKHCGASPLSFRG